MARSNQDYDGVASDREHSIDHAASQSGQLNHRNMSDTGQTLGRNAFDQEHEQTTPGQGRLQALLNIQQQLQAEQQLLHDKQQRNLQLILNEVNADAETDLSLMRTDRQRSTVSHSLRDACLPLMTGTVSHDQSLLDPVSKHSKRDMVTLPAPVALMGSGDNVGRDEERIRQAMSLSSNGGKRSHIFLDDDEDLNNSNEHTVNGTDAASIRRRKTEPARAKRVANLDRPLEDFKVPKAPKSGSFPRRPTSPYPNITLDKKYDMIVQSGEGSVVELRCKFCEGNYTHKGPIKGVPGIFAHLKVAHKRTYSYKWIVENCAAKLLTAEEIDQVRKGGYLVLQRRVKQMDLNKTDGDAGHEDDECELSA